MERLASTTGSPKKLDHFDCSCVNRFFFVYITYVTFISIIAKHSDYSYWTFQRAWSNLPYRLLFFLVKPTKFPRTTDTPETGRNQSAFVHSSDQSFAARKWPLCSYESHRKWAGPRRTRTGGCSSSLLKHQTALFESKYANCNIVTEGENWNVTVKATPQQHLFSCYRNSL